jgi:hypothetical protein
MHGTETYTERKNSRGLSRYYVFKFHRKVRILTSVYLLLSANTEYAYVTFRDNENVYTCYSQEW